MTLRDLKAMTLEGLGLGLYTVGVLVPITLALLGLAWGLKLLLQ